MLCYILVALYISHVLPRIRISLEDNMCVMRCAARERSNRMPFFVCSFQCVVVVEFFKWRWFLCTKFCLCFPYRRVRGSYSWWSHRFTNNLKKKTRKQLSFLCVSEEFNKKQAYPVEIVSFSMLLPFLIHKCRHEIYKY